jgi:hypothetical protein
MGPFGDNSNCMGIDCVFIEKSVPGGGVPVAAAVELPALATSAMAGLGAFLAMIGRVDLRRRRMH